MPSSPYVQQPRDIVARGAHPGLNSSEALVMPGVLPVRAIKRPLHGTAENTSEGFPPASADYL
jgi:hypothetical protein